MTNRIELKRVVVVLVVIALLFGIFGCKEKAEAIEPNFVGIDIAWEPNYPIDLKLYGDTANCATFSLGADNEIICDTTREKYLKILYQSLSGKEPNCPVTMKFKDSEPNEPNDLISGTTNIWDSTTSLRYSLPIPTWPDYIELEKDLVIHCPNDFLDIGGSYIEVESKEIFGKGTKIYFKE